MFLLTITKFYKFNNSLVRLLLEHVLNVLQMFDFKMKIEEVWVYTVGES